MRLLVTLIGFAAIAGGAAPLPLSGAGGVERCPGADGALQAIALNVRVTSAAGAPVRGLTAADFAVTSAGGTLGIRFVREIDRPARAIGLLLDDAQLLYTDVDTAFRIRQLGETLIGELSAADRIVVASASGAQQALATTPDRQAAMAALDTAYRSILTTAHASYDAGLSLRALQRIVGVVARDEADVSFVVYVTRPAFSIAGAGDSARGRAVAQLVASLVERARSAGVIVHTIAPDEKVTATRNSISGYRPFLVDVAADTGGLFLMPRADAAGAARQIVRDSSHVYRLVLQADGDHDAVGPIDVRVRGEGLTARTTLAPRSR
jgi:hypothetical protein